MVVVIETPRALISKGQRELGLRNLCKLRGLPEDHPYVRGEYMEICAQADAEQEKAKGKSDIALLPFTYCLEYNFPTKR